MASISIATQSPVVDYIQLLSSKHDYASILRLQSSNSLSMFTAVHQSLFLPILPSINAHNLHKNAKQLYILLYVDSVSQPTNHPISPRFLVRHVRIHTKYRNNSLAYNESKKESCLTFPGPPPPWTHSTMKDVNYIPYPQLHTSAWLH
jgi:hypothetical protein